jgi:dTDP-4-amino-4,6-dideoxygalactose transaminase
MNIPFVDLKTQYQSIKPEIDAAISNVLENAAFIAGENLASFEANFATHMGVSHCIGCANGTDAIEIALEALGIGEGDEVLVPAYTWVSTASAVSRVGANPIFVDIHPDYYTIDVDNIEPKLTSRTKAIITVHYYGLPADMDSIIKIAKVHNLKVIEDCAQAHNATINGQKVGSFGDIATYSFYPGKNLGAYGDGGAIITNSKDLNQKARMIARLGQQGKHNHVITGRNSRLDGIQAGILNVKLTHLQDWTAKRQLIASWYFELLKELPIKLPMKPEGFGHVYHLFVIQSDDRNKLKEFLEQNGISTQIHYPKPLHQVGIFTDQGAFPVAEAMSEKLLSLPMYAELNKVQVEYVALGLKKFFT